MAYDSAPSSSTTACASEGAAPKINIQLKRGLRKMESHKKRFYMKDGWVNWQPLHLVVGADGQQFVLHESLLTGLSEAMKEEVSRATYEIFGKKVVWPQFEATTVACLIEFAYAGDFMSPGFLKMHSDYFFEEPHHTFADRTPNFNGLRALEGAWHQFARASLEHNDEQMVYEVDEDSSAIDGLCSIARVYNLADDFGIKRLQKLCLIKLHRLMICHNHRLDVVGFLSLCVKQCGNEGVLFRLAVKYATLMAEFFKDDREFQEVAG